MVKVIAWPPVGITGFSSSRIDPVVVSESLINNTPIYSSFGRSRRTAQVTVSGLADTHAAGAGYMEMLKLQLAGGKHCIRMNDYGAIWHLIRAGRRSDVLNGVVSWEVPEEGVDWTVPSAGVDWLINEGITAVPSQYLSTYPCATISGLPANTTVVRPGEYITIFDGNDPEVSETRQVLSVGTTNSSGVAKVRVTEAFTLSGVCSLGAIESVVYRLNGPMPDSPLQPQAGDWTYTWDLIEAFEDEYDDGFVEDNPWVSIVT